MRIVGSGLIIAAYFITLNLDVVTGAVVSCIRQLDHMTGTGYNSHRGYGFHRRLH